MAQNELLEPFERMLAKLFEPAEIRRIEQGGDWAREWQEIEESGFLDALVPEESGGVGLSLAQMCPLLIALGKHAVPLPIGETIIARALLAIICEQIPEGAVAVTTDSSIAPNGRFSNHILGLAGDHIWLCESENAELQSEAQPGVIENRISGRPVESAAVAIDGCQLQLYAALLRSAFIAGAAQKVLDISIAYANERQQFGKPIGRQQALQQQLAVMAEQVVAMRMAVEMACAPNGVPTKFATATAKAITSEFGPLVANCGHAVHGAIGISEEYDLQLYTKRLLALSRVDGGSGYWSKIIGEAAIESGDKPVDWIRQNLFG